jgi:hypothetical protein
MGCVDPLSEDQVVKPGVGTLFGRTDRACRLVEEETGTPRGVGTHSEGSLMRPPGQRGGQCRAVRGSRGRC